MASFAILCLHGLVDNPFAENWAKPLLFMIPGFLIATEKPVTKPKSKPAVPLKFLVPLILIAGFTGFIVYQARVHPLLLANIGAVKMAQIDLGDFPAGEWDDGSDTAAYTESEQYFIDTIGIDPDNTTANYRLGLISMLCRDFERAAGYLEVAYSASSNHRGIIKSLGYCYTWLGRLDKAEVVLAKINETRAEMRTYAWWWQSQGYPQYAEWASQMAERLEAAELSQ
jgi:tetratricopeptide (TPR) repeat protein